MELRNFSQAKAALERVRRTSIRTAAGSVLAGVAAVGVVIGVTMMSGGTALASPTPIPSRTNGNIPPGQGNPCIAAGLSGSVLFGGLSPDLFPNPAAGSGTVYDGGTIDGEQDFLDVTINLGYTASGIVVAAGGDQNVYHGPFVGLDTIIGMHGPTNGGGNETPTISHWYVCGDTSPSESPSASPSESPSESPSPSPSESPSPSPSESPSPSPSESPSPSPSESPSESPSASPSSSPSESPSESPSASPSENCDPAAAPAAAAAPCPSTPAPSTTTPDLPKTGTSLSGVLVTGSALLVGGIGLLLIVSGRRRNEDMSTGNPA